MPAVAERVVGYARPLAAVNAPSLIEQVRRIMFYSVGFVPPEFKGVYVDTSSAYDVMDSPLFLDLLAMVDERKVDKICIASKLAVESEWDVLERYPHAFVILRPRVGWSFTVRPDPTGVCLVWRGRHD